MDTKKAAKKACAGNKGAMNLLYERYKHRLYFLCLSLLRDEGDASDALRTSFKKVFTSMQGKSGCDGFEELIITETVRHCKPGLKNEAPRIIKDEGGIRTLDDRDLITPDNISEEQKKAVLDSVSDLPDYRRAAVLLNALYGYSPRMIAAALKIPEDKASNDLEYGREGVKKYLRANISPLSKKGIIVLLSAMGGIFREEADKQEVDQSADTVVNAVAERLAKPSKLSKAAVIAVAIIIAAAVSALILINPFGSSDDGDTESAEDSSIKTTSTTTGLHHAEIEIEGYGTVSIELDADSAPISVENFIDLANDGFYDGLTFHRIIEGFMMQGGDPNGDGTGGSDTCIKGEFSNNGVKNDLSHTRGAVSMARSTEYDSASSQFFIVHEDSTYLDGDYAVFGYVTDGMDIVDEICESAEVTDSNGSVSPENQPVITSVTILD